MADRPNAPRPPTDGIARTPRPDEPRPAGDHATPSQQGSPPNSNHPSAQRGAGPLHDASLDGPVGEESPNANDRRTTPRRDTTPDGNWEIPWSNRDRVPRELHPRLERLGERTEDFVDTVEVAIGRAVPRPLRVLQNARQNTMINVIWRAGVLLVGLTFVSAGVAMLLLPGPGWASIILGLVVLASEYTWANRLLLPVRRRARAAARRARQWDPRLQRAVTVATAVGSLAIIAGSVWYVVNYGWSTPW